MREDNKANKLHALAQQYEQSNPAKAIIMLKEIVKNYKDTYVVHNYVIPDILITAIQNQMWDEAKNICIEAGNLYPDEIEWWQLELQACKFEENGLIVEATETHFKQDTLRGKYYLTYLRFGDRFTQLDRHDRAWQLYNQAISLAAKEKYSPHRVRESMANLLLKEEKPSQAAEILIFGICEAEAINKGGAPKSMVTLLKKALKKMGIDNSDLAEQIMSVCKTKGRQKALDLLGSRITNKPT